MAVKQQFGSGGPGGAAGPTDVGSVFGLQAGAGSAPVVLGTQAPYGSADTMEHTTSSRTVVGTVLQSISSFHHFDADTRAGAIDAMVSAGYLSAKDIGKPSSVDSAWKRATLDAARTATYDDKGNLIDPGKSVFSLLDQRAQENAASGANGSTRPPFVAELTNPDDIKAVLRDAFKTKNGRGEIPEDRLNAMVAAYQGTEKQFQQQEYNLTTTGGAGGTATRAPDLSTFADTQAHQADPTAYDANKVVNTLSLFAKALGGQ